MTENQIYSDQSSEAGCPPSVCEYGRRGGQENTWGCVLDMQSSRPLHPHWFSPIPRHTIGNHNSTQRSRVGTERDNEDKQNHKGTAPWTCEQLQKLGRGSMDRQFHLLAGAGVSQTRIC